MMKTLSRRTALARIILCLAFIPAGASSQWRQTKYQERFDSGAPPSLPAGWASSTLRSPDGDVTLTRTGALSPPGCVVSTNATVAQWLASPALDLRGWRECALRWMERRSATHDGTIVIEASTDGGETFAQMSDDTIRPSGTTTYVERSVALPEWLPEQQAVSIRWRMQGDGTGATGTIRLDDISISGRPRHDLSLSAGGISPPRPPAGEEVWCSGHVVNTGYDESGESTLVWAPDLDGDGSVDESEIRGSVEPGWIPPGDSAEYAFSFRREGSAQLAIIALIRSDSDMAAENDTVRFQLPAAVAPLSVVINEIMYDPSPGRAEYVEIYNRSGEMLNLSGWHLTDREDDSTSGSFGTGELVLAPGAYLLCSPDTTIMRDYADIPAGVALIEAARGFTLNNTGDRLILTDGSGGTIDRIDYTPQWHTPALENRQGRSLERIESGTSGSGAWNWGTSAGASGGTPGYRNSLATGLVKRDERLNCSPNPFSPDGDGVEDVTGIGYRLGEGAVIARVRIYDAEGRPVRTITGGDYVTGAGSFAWNGYDDRGRRVPIGIYLILLDAVDASGTSAMSAKGVVVVGGKL